MLIVVMLEILKTKSQLLDIASFLIEKSSPSAISNNKQFLY